MELNFFLNGNFLERKVMKQKVAGNSKLQTALKKFCDVGRGHNVNPCLDKMKVCAVRKYFPLLHLHC